MLLGAERTTQTVPARSAVLSTEGHASQESEEVGTSGTGPQLNGESGDRPFGFWWEKPESDLAWYDWMFHYRLGVHRAFIDWLVEREREFGKFESVLDVGCGRGVFYPHYFARRRFMGLEYSARNIEWLREHRSWPGHDYERGDITTFKAAEPFDLVYSSGTIDNVPDMDAFLAGMVGNTRRTLYLTAYRGWFPELLQHRLSYGDETGAYYNDISPSRVREVLLRLGCRNIVVEPLPTGRPEIPHETVIIADAGA